MSYAGTDRRTMLDDPCWAGRLRRATDSIGRGTYTGPERRATTRRMPVNRYAANLQAAADEAVLDDLYERAADDGEIRYLRATRTDPGCYAEEIDLTLGPLSLGAEDTDLDELVAEVEATVAGRYLFKGVYAFAIDIHGYDGRMTITDREEI